MPTVGTQPVRTRHQYRDIALEDDLEFMDELAERCAVSLADLIALRHVRALEVRNSFAQEDGDYRDEHVAGVCAALDGIAVALHQLSVK